MIHNQHRACHTPTRERNDLVEHLGLLCWYNEGDYRVRLYARVREFLLLYPPDKPWPRERWKAIGHEVDRGARPSAA